jgi:hypothetical protein
VSVPARPAAIVGEIHMSEMLEWRERLESAHKHLLDAMTELITNKNYSEGEQLLHVVDELMVDLIKDMGGNIIKSGLWT